MESALVIDLQLDFSPIVEPFAEGRAFFFCPLEEQVNRIVAKNFVTVQGEKVVLNKWDRNIDTFNYNGNQCGGLLENCYSTKNFLDLLEARIQVKATPPSSVPWIIHLLENTQWFILQISPLSQKQLSQNKMTRFGIEEIVGPY